LQKNLRTQAFLQVYQSEEPEILLELIECKNNPNLRNNIFIGVVQGAKNAQAVTRQNFNRKATLKALVLKEFGDFGVNMPNQM
jgi:hypothetical protein